MVMQLCQVLLTKQFESGDEAYFGSNHCIIVFEEKINNLFSDFSRFLKSGINEKETAYVIVFIVNQQNVLQYKDTFFAKILLIHYFSNYIECQVDIEQSLFAKIKLDRNPDSSKKNVINNGKFLLNEEEEEEMN
ncbi:hypothetical protein RFI_07959, partial [Reticulomyxa filosa]